VLLTDVEEKGSRTVEKEVLQGGGEEAKATQVDTFRKEGTTSLFVSKGETNDKRKSIKNGESRKEGASSEPVLSHHPSLLVGRRVGKGNQKSRCERNSTGGQRATGSTVVGGGRRTDAVPIHNSGVPLRGTRSHATRGKTGVLKVVREEGGT